MGAFWALEKFRVLELRQGEPALRTTKRACDLYSGLVRVIVPSWGNALSATIVAPTQYESWLI